MLTAYIFNTESVQQLINFRLHFHQIAWTIWTICHHYAKNYQIWWKFDVVITKIILLVF